MRPQEKSEGEIIECIGREVSKPVLIHWNGAHRALKVKVKGYPAIAEVKRAWRVKK
jgi:hypothetical protein